MSLPTSTELVSLLALLCYGIAALRQSRRLFHEHKAAEPKLLSIIALGLLLHGVVIHQTLFVNGSLDLSISKMSSLTAWVITLVALVSCLQKPLQNLFAFILPLVMVTLLVGLLPQEPVLLNVKTEMVVHILLSLTAYSVLAIATLQALLLALQDKQLHKHQSQGLIRALPPLQTMDALLFELLSVGFVLLSASILSGFMFLEDMFAQHLVHKTIFSLAGWFIYGGLLLGRYLLGWRGLTAVKWTLAGFCLLMLAYFGSKLVIELILTTG